MMDANDGAVPTDEAGRLLSKEDIFGADDLAPITVHVPEWNGNVRLRPLTALESMAFQASIKKNEQDASVRLLAASAIDADGQQLFTEADLKSLRGKSLRAIMRLQNAALVLNGLKEDGAEAKNA